MVKQVLLIFTSRRVIFTGGIGGLVYTLDGGRRVTSPPDLAQPESSLTNEESFSINDDTQQKYSQHCT